MRHGDEPITMIVGASGIGIGPAVAKRLARERHHLALVGRTEERLEALAREVQGDAASVRVIPGDATRPKKVRRMVDEMLIHYGRVDNLVYVPSASGFGPFLETTLAHLEEHLELSLRAPWHWMQAVLPTMRDHGGGRLIFMSATAGRRGFPGMAAFSAAHFALHGLIESVAREYRAENIQPVAVVLDGTLDHPGTRQRFPDKEDWSDTIGTDAVAEAVAFLCRQSGRSMTHELWLTPSKERF